MSKLKKLTDEDLSNISDKFGDILELEISRKIPIKELEDFDLNIIINYENNQLDVSVDLDCIVDLLSEINETEVNQVVDEAYLKLDSFIEGNYTI